MTNKRPVTCNEDKVFNKNEQEFLTEAQLPTAGPILIDLDFRYSIDIEERQHTGDHIMDTVELYLEQLTKIVKMTDQTFPVFVLEKPNVLLNERNSETVVNSCFVEEPSN